MREESAQKMAHQVSSDHVPSTNDERVSLPSSQQVPLESKAAVISESNVKRAKTCAENIEKDNTKKEISALQDTVSSSPPCLPCKEVMTSTSHCEASPKEEDNGRERLKRHRIEVAGRVWIPDIWGQEDLLKDLIDCSAFDACLVPNGIISARAALVEEGRRAISGRLRIENRC